MSLFCIHDLICKNQALSQTLCDNNDTLTELAETLCDKIDELVGDPDAECPECLVEEDGVVEEAQAQTAAIKEVTAAIQIKTAAVKTALNRG